jgi:surface protein
MKRLLILLVTMVACIAAWAAEGYAVYTPDNTTLTFYYGDKPTGAFKLNTDENFPNWYDLGYSQYITRVVFDPSFAQARPTSTAYWFALMTKLTTITGLNYLNTSEVKYMTFMFYDCMSLTTLDLRTFNTAKVTTMRGMFSVCIDLTTIDLSTFNTSNVKNMQGMFASCMKLTHLDLSSFNTSKVESMEDMFYSCLKLNRIDVTDDWSINSIRYSNDMFKDCTNLVGGAGTTYDANHVDATYAHIDGGPSNPGYLTEKHFYDLWINGEQVTNLNCTDLGNIGGVTGTVSYNPSTNTLMLDNATIDQRGLTECAISTAYGAPANLKIKLVGENKILANDNTIAINIKESHGFTLYGSGTLNCGGALYLSVRDHMINDATLSYIENCSVYIHEIMSEDYEECLTIDNADVTTEYLDVGSDHNGYKGLNLVNCYVASPADGVVGSGGCIMVNGDYWDGHVEIKRSGIAGDVNGDGIVTAADVTAIYDYLLNNDTSNLVNGDVNGDGNVTAGDVTEIYNILLGN